MSKHGRGSDGLRRGSRSRHSNDSLRDMDANTISGGMGERKTTSEESRHGFADDELESLSFVGPRTPKTSSNKCRRCQAELSTKARYCRRCYEEREKWMPLRPTRQKRRRPRNEHSQERPSNPRNSVRSLDRGTDWDRLFNPVATVQKGPRGEGMRLPDSNFSNLPQFARERKYSTSSVSSDEFRQERRREWMKRRAYYFRWEGEGADEIHWGEVLPRCLVCKVHQVDAYIIHGSTAHACVCQRCAMALLERQGRCPQCHTKATGITKKPR